jgi:hypothetical protein
MRWAEYVALMREMGNAYKILVGIPSHGSIEDIWT